MKRPLALLLIALAALAVYVATRPSEFAIQRSALVDAPPGVVFANLEDFRRWEPWSPWEKLDPQMERRYEGPSSGVGASYHWRGNRDVGEGRMTVLKTKPPERLTIRLEFLAPFQATNQVVFDVTPDLASMTEVKWTMTGHNGFVAKAMGLFVNVEATVSRDFDRGLAALKRVSEEQYAAAEELRRTADAAGAAGVAEAAPVEGAPAEGPAEAAPAPAEPAAASD
jgi:hypothetical protein